MLAFRLYPTICSKSLIAYSSRLKWLTFPLCLIVSLSIPSGFENITFLLKEWGILPTILSLLNLLTWHLFVPPFSQRLSASVAERWLAFCSSSLHHCCKSCNLTILLIVSFIFCCVEYVRPTQRCFLNELQGVVSSNLSEAHLSLSLRCCTRDRASLVNSNWSVTGHLS